MFPLKYVGNWDFDSYFRAKRIINHAVVNEDPNARIIRELRAEVDALKEMLKHATVKTILFVSICHNPIKR